MAVYSDSSSEPSAIYEDERGNGKEIQVNALS